MLSKAKAGQLCISSEKFPEEPVCVCEGRENRNRERETKSKKAKQQPVRMVYDPGK